MLSDFPVVLDVALDVVAIADSAVLNVNNIECYIQNNGKIGEHPETGGDGFFYPKGQRNSSIIFTGGIWVVGKIGDDIRTACADYSTEFQPGMILPDGNADDATKPEYKIYKYNRGDAVDPIAINQGCPSEVIGDQMAFCVFNDLTDHTVVFTKPPIGLEATLTAFGFNYTGALGNTLFYKFKFTNKGVNTLDSAFVAVFFDPDDGDGNDDYVGCDTNLGIGYVFNGDNYDDKYKAEVPALGCDFFQGPIVPEAGSTATLPDGTVLTDQKILQMMSFFAYIRNSPVTGMNDPTLQDAAGAQEAYYFVRGFRGNGEPWTDPVTGLETQFPFSGDPILNTGWLMSSITPPKDMRMGLSAGPFTLAPNDPKEVVIGLVVGQGADNMASVALMKYYDRLAQNAYDKNFDLPSPPPVPQVSIAQDDGSINLTWDQASSEYSDKGYNFEGYNLYQGLSASGPWTRVATIDKANLVTTIWDDNYSEALATVLQMPVQFGGDAGLRYDFFVEKDYLNNSPLVNGRSYYFAVTGYAYNPNGVPKTLENAPIGREAVPQRPVVDVKYNAAIGDTIGVTTYGSTDAYVIAEVMDPKAITGHTYKIKFYNITDENSAHFEEMAWSLTDSTTGEVLLRDQFHQTSDPGDEDWPVTAGMKIKVYGAPNNYKNFQVVANANGPLDPPEIGTFAFNGNGFPLLIGYDGNPILDDTGAQVDRPTARQQVGGGKWGLATAMNSPTMSAGFDYFLVRTSDSGALWSYMIPNDFEIRFTAAGSKAYDLDSGNLIDVPFEIWNVGQLSNPNDDVRLVPWMVDDDGNGRFNLLSEPSIAAAPADWSYGFADHAVSGGNNDPQTDWFYGVRPADETPGQAGYEALIAKIQAEGSGYVNLDGTNGYAIRRLVLVNWNGGDCATGVYNQDMCETGTIFRIVTTKPNNPTVQYAINTASYMRSKSAAVAKQRLSEINVFPNPYFGHNTAEGSFFEQIVTFNNLPENNCTIRIFSISGQLVRTLVHDNGTPFERWNLQNEESLPVASGMFIAHIETAYGDKILKLGIVNREQRYLHM